MKRILRLMIFGVFAFVCLWVVLPVVVFIALFQFTDFDLLGPCQPELLFNLPVYPNAVEIEAIYRKDDPNYEIERHYSVEANHGELIDFFERQGLNCYDESILATVCSNRESVSSTSVYIEARIPTSDEVTQYTLYAKWSCSD